MLIEELISKIDLVPSFASIICNFSGTPSVTDRKNFSTSTTVVVVEVLVSLYCQKEISIMFWSGMFGCSYFINLEDGTIGLVFKQVYDLKNLVDYDEVYQDIIFDMLY